MGIHIIDSFMGSGKSTWAYKYMNEHPDQKYIYIALFLDECNRVKRECQNLNFYLPDPAPTKQRSFKKLACSGRNIATTHALLSQLSLADGEYMQIKEQNYVFIIDEVVETVQPFTALKESEFQALVKSGYINVEDSGTVTLSKQEPNSLYRYHDAFDFIRSGSVFQFENNCLMWTMPENILQLADEMYVLTFLFEASHLKHTFDMFKFSYDIYHIQNGELVPGKESLTEKKRLIKEHLIITDDPDLNKNKNERSFLSANWWKNSSPKDRTLISNKIRNYFRYKATGKYVPAAKCLWTVYGETAKKDARKKRKFSVKDFDTAAISFNQKATNQYGDRYCLAYPVNVFEHLVVFNWFKKMEQPLSHDLFALSTMLQWIWRSAIRNDKNVYIYLPSKRMENILKNWLNSNS